MESITYTSDVDKTKITLYNREVDIKLPQVFSIFIYHYKSIHSITAAFSVEVTRLTIPITCSLEIYNKTDTRYTPLMTITNICGTKLHFGVGPISIEMIQLIPTRTKRFAKYVGYISLSKECLGLSQTDSVTIETYGIHTTVMMIQKYIPFNLPILRTWINYKKLTTRPCSVKIHYQYLINTFVPSIHRAGCGPQEVGVSCCLC